MRYLVLFFFLIVGNCNHCFWDYKLKYKIYVYDPLNLSSAKTLESNIEMFFTVLEENRRNRDTSWLENWKLYLESETIVDNEFCKPDSKIGKVGCLGLTKLNGPNYTRLAIKDPCVGKSSLTHEFLHILEYEDTGFTDVNHSFTDTDKFGNRYWQGDKTVKVKNSLEYKIKMRQQELCSNIIKPAIQ